MSTTIPVTDSDFEKTVLKAEVPVVVDFWAPWCGPCRAVAPILEELAGVYGSRLTIAKVNTDEDAEWAGKFGIMAIPTMLVFKNGVEVKRLIGARPRSALQAEFDQLLAS